MKLPARSRRAWVPAFAAALLASGGAAAADISVLVVGVRSNAGNVHIALYDDAARFPKSDGMVRKFEAPIDGRRARATFAGMPPGRYAVAVYHDENDNDEFDQGILGIPLEDYAFSRNAAVFLAPPSFSAAAFDVPPAGVTIEIRLGAD